MRIAVLALQGAFVEHEYVLQGIGVNTIQIRQYDDWNSDIDGLVLPGGESTTMTGLLKQQNLYGTIRRAIENGLPVLATCAGMILLAKTKDGQTSDGLSTLDVDVRRNAYGRQLGSFNRIGSINNVADNFPMVFIRAPYANRVLADDVEILSTVDNNIVAVRQGNQLCTAFHPELTNDTRLHEYFLSICRQRAE